MNQNRPNFSQLLSKTQREVCARLGVKPSSIPSTLDVFSSVHAGMMHNLYGYLMHYILQMSPKTAEGQFLDRLADALGMKRLRAAFSSGDVIFQSTEATDIKKGVLFRSLSGFQYTLVDDLTLELDAQSNVYQKVGRVVAIEAGKKGNILEDRSLFFEETPLSLSHEVLVLGAGIQGGSDEEDDASLRERIVQFQEHSSLRYGKKGDFQFWALQAHPEVKKVFEIPNSDGFGLLSVICMGRDEIPLSSNVIQRVQDKIKAMAPFGVRFQALPAQLLPMSLHLDLQGFVDDLDAIKSAAKEWFQETMRTGMNFDLKLKKSLETFIIRKSTHLSSVTASLQKSKNNIPFDTILVLKEVLCKTH